MSIREFLYLISISLEELGNQFLDVKIDFVFNLAAVAVVIAGVVGLCAFIGEQLKNLRERFNSKIFSPFLFLGVIVTCASISPAFQHLDNGRLVSERKLIEAKILETQIQNRALSDLRYSKLTDTQKENQLNVRLKRLGIYESYTAEMNRLGQNN